MFTSRFIRGPHPGAESYSCQKPSRAPLPAFFTWHCIPSSVNPQYTFPAFLLTVPFQTAYNSTRIYAEHSQPFQFIATYKLCLDYLQYNSPFQLLPIFQDQLQRPLLSMKPCFVLQVKWDLSILWLCAILYLQPLRNVSFCALYYCPSALLLLNENVKSLRTWTDPDLSGCYACIRTPSIVY